MLWVALGVLVAGVGQRGQDLVRPGPGAPTVWGIEGGIHFTVWPHDVGGSRSAGGPRGLIRVGYPILEDGGVWLVNFIAVEPIIEGAHERGLSELEPSASDGKPGKRIEVGPPPGEAWTASEEGEPYPGLVQELEGGARRLTICLAVERFDSGAHVRVLASVRTDRPEELELRVYAEDDSAPLRACILSATMGNYERLRELHLAERVVTAGELYGGYTGHDFAPHTRFALGELARAADGSVVVPATTDEEEPSRTLPDPARGWFWYYPGAKLTQYWRKYPDTLQDELYATVNARRVYWASEWPIPGGVAFENFELNERFTDGQAQVFALTPKTPRELLQRAGDP